MVLSGSADGRSATRKWDGLQTPCKQLASGWGRGVLLVLDPEVQYRWDQFGGLSKSKWELKGESLCPLSRSVMPQGGSEMSRALAKIGIDFHRPYSRCFFAAVVVTCMVMAACSEPQRRT